MEIVLLVAPDVVVQTSEGRSFSSEEVGRTTGDVHRRRLGQFGGDVVGICIVGCQAQFRRRWRGRNQDVENRAARALHFTQMVEPGDESTRAKK